MLNETFNLLQKVYNTKTGKNPLLIYIDPKTSSDNTFESKEKFKEYGMDYLPNKLGKYAPHAWGWILWNGEQDKQMAYVKAFINDLPSIETAPEKGQERGFKDITSNLEPVIQEMLENLEAAEKVQPKTAQDEETKKRIESFKEMISKGLNDEKTLQFLENLIKYRTELRKHNAYNLGWTNIMLAWFARNGKATQIRPLKEWNKMGYQPKPGVQPINLLGKGYRHKAFTPEEKAKIIQAYLEAKGVDSVDELPESSKYDLMNRKLKGKAIPGSEYQFGYNAYDIQDVEPIPGAKQETEPEEPEDNWWWMNLPADEKDIELTSALIEFLESPAGGNIVVNVNNSRQDLDGARGNAGGGMINLINDGKMRFPTAAHEALHALRHQLFASQNNPALKRFYNRNANRDVLEQEAELASAFLASEFGYKNIQHSINYLKNWKLSPEMVTKVFDQISDVCNYISENIRKNLKNNNNENKQEQ